ncbi:hypothetical protein BB559_004051 [Furculomyces boomerangus]|uniref:MoaB/Mog domain-containing protein n=2 Tax=Harpellales TaxID=61421 RepID=A0A2T9YGZ5_9FUNG|nr:hypothetical protein BB559_004051 [Furculomyces boomerangus]PVZ98252.1 hypothetical protein BB558_005747 [Smittium angustum]
MAKFLSILKHNATFPYLFCKNNFIFKRSFSFSSANFENTLKLGGCIIGDEIISGRVKDTNFEFLAKKCYQLGIDLRKVEFIRDDMDDISAAVRRLSKEHDLVITSGGIGPTHDDITYKAVAKAFRQGMAYHNETLVRMRDLFSKNESYNTIPDPVGTEEQVAVAKMALFPEKAQTFFLSPKHCVPAVVVDRNVVILPGSPSFFQSMVNEFLKSYLENKLPGLEINADKSYGSSHGFTCKTLESVLHEPKIASELTMLQNKYSPSGIRIGSYPLWASETKSTKKLTKVVISVEGTSKEIVERCYDELDELIKRLENKYKA